jgi:hypothetical protein
MTQVVANLREKGYYTPNAPGYSTTHFMFQFQTETLPKFWMQIL